MPYDAHDQAVMDRINRYIDAANAQFPDRTVAEKLEWCWSQNIKERESDSRNTVGRDADYYFASRHVIAADSSAFAKAAHYAGGFVATVGYIDLKLITTIPGVDRIPGVDTLMRTDPDKPNAPPGGLEWELRGANDGFRDTGANRTDVIRHLSGDGPAAMPPPSPAAGPDMSLR
ncbi:hypothetical protein ACFOD9_09695 [Novosphingobium bradum]|uniref:Uncharacterized protein n=1 Tax=Novosphingobium bradum TaxID=1737444 RepID=A0ABV7IPD1_9SPHN